MTTSLIVAGLAVDLEDKPQYLSPFLALLLLTKIRIITRALQDERDDQILFILEMPQQGSVEALDLSGKPFGHAERVTVATRHFAGKRSNELTACGAEAMDRAVDHPVVIVENVEALLQFWCSDGEGGEIVVILNTMVPIKLTEQKAHPALEQG
jgi:hypothetical protein